MPTIKTRPLHGILCVLLFVAHSLFGGIALAGSFDALEQVVAQAKDFSDFVAQPKLVEAYKAALQEYYGSQKFQCESFEMILRNLKQLNKQVPGLGEELWKVQAARNITYYRVPDDATGVREKWELAQVPRKLHGIWNDPSRKGCTGEDCSKAEVSAPERWAGALPGSRTYLLHRDGKFQGAGALVLPLAKGKQAFSLVVLTGSEAMQVTARYSADMTGGGRFSTLYDLFLDPLNGGLAVVSPIGVQYDPKDPQIARMMRLRPANPKDTFAGFLDAFQPADAMAVNIARVVPRQCHASKDVKKGMNLFAGFGVAGSGITASVSAADVAKIAMQISNPNTLTAAVNVPPGQQAALGKSLAALMAQNKDAVIRQKAAMALGMLEKNMRRTPASAAAGNRAPDSTSDGSASVSPFAPSFKAALKDSDSGVRTQAAAALSRGGDGSPPVRAVLKDAISGEAGAAAGLTSADLANIAAMAKNEPNAAAGKVLPQEFGALVGIAAEESDRGKRSALIKTIANSYVRSPNAEVARDELQKAVLKNPEMQGELLKDVNEVDCEDPTSSKKEKAT